MSRKILALLLTVMLILAVTSLTASAYSNSNWMGSLDSSLSLSQLSIPGTHDSGATVEPVAGTAKCQDLSITDQLNAGIRYLDIRCRHINDTFAIHHGSVYQNLNFDDVLNSCISFLNSNPTECVIMSVKEEYTASGNTRSFEQTFESYVAKNPGKWYLDATIPTLSQAKGKIVLLRRFGANTLPKGIDASVGWADNATFTIDNGSAQLKVQDNYNVSDNNAKWTSISNLYNEAKYQNYNWLYINYSSGVKSILGVPSITSVSNDINPRITTFFTANNSGRFGITAMDFADAAKSSLIIAANFPPANGTYKVINYNSNKAMDVAGGSTADGGDVIQWDYSGGNNQKWTFQDQGSGYYKIINVQSGKALDVSGGSTTNGGDVIQWTWSGGDNQLWKVIPNLDGTFRIINKNSGLALEVYGVSTSNGGNVDQWSWGGGTNQKWLIQAP